MEVSAFSLLDVPVLMELSKCREQENLETKHSSLHDY